jgi:hypothetical protein
MFVFWDPLMQASSVKGVNSFTDPPTAHRAAGPAGPDARAEGAQP